MKIRNAIIFGGESPRHEQWVRDVEAVLRPHFDEVRYLDYKHWEAGGVDIDLEGEIDRIAIFDEKLTDYIVIAKSIGTVIATLGVGRGLIHPKRCVFLGFPLVRVTDIDEMAVATTVLPPTMFVHNEFDKIGSAVDTWVYVEAHAPAEYSFEVVPGNATHDYVDLAHIAELATR